MKEVICPQCNRIDKMRFEIRGEGVKIKVCCVECVKKWAEEELA